MPRRGCSALTEPLSAPEPVLIPVISGVSRPAPASLAGSRRLARGAAGDTRSRCCQFRRGPRAGVLRGCGDQRGPWGSGWHLS